MKQGVGINMQKYHTIGSSINSYDNSLKLSRSCSEGRSSSFALLRDDKNVKSVINSSVTEAKHKIHFDYFDRENDCSDNFATIPEYFRKLNSRCILTSRILNIVVTVLF
ncbi:hypothetical protein HHI36_008178 [Cryptolaemus montrouzieri]|uniref:Uncharacterized protein n=1 Tax=Cryptolaemus montrouzieri TaxID=559131 RepID=A0ABD2MSM1_9CUCU